MISSINPIGPSSPSGDSPDVSSVAQALGTELDDLSVTLLHLKYENVGAQLSKVANQIVHLSEGARKALRIGSS